MRISFVTLKDIVSVLFDSEKMAQMKENPSILRTCLVMRGTKWSTYLRQQLGLLQAIVHCRLQ
jgi:hypothetical protein